jgi:glutathione S-transferase
MPENIPNVHAPYTLYKMDVSYFSGKIEAYLKYKSIPHVAVERGMTKDDKWLFDSTPIMQWFETQYPASPILSDDPALKFLMLLMQGFKRKGAKK